MSAMADADAEDVNDFLKRIQELGTRRDREDEERNRKLEEEILQGRRERQARRAERARSISPTKDSPAATPTTTERFETSVITTLSYTPDLKPSEDSTRESNIRAAMDRLTGSDSPTKATSTPLAGSHPENFEIDVLSTAIGRTSPCNSIFASRDLTISQQQRGTCQLPERLRTQTLSIIAAGNSARSARATPDPSEAEDQFSISRDQVSQMLGSKDPAWFRQTADRGENSPAYRRNQVEDSDVVEVVSTSRRQLPGMAREPSLLTEKVYKFEDADRALPTSGTISSDMSKEKNTFTKVSSGSTGIGSLLPLTHAQRLDPPEKFYPDDKTFESGRAPAMSPSQGRISPDRPHHQATPTKGMGGFVQSAMMKRSDSVNKRWSKQSPTRMSRGNLIAVNRGIVDPNTNIGIGVGKTNQEPGRSNVSRDNSPMSHSRPTSSHNNATITQSNERPDTSSSMRSSMTTSTTKDGFVNPLLQMSRVSPKKDGEIDSQKDDQDEPTAPESPSKLQNAPKRSPTKASWLESALNKPDSSKPKAGHPPQQPSWMLEIAKAKQRGGTDQVRGPLVHKHDVNIGGLLRSQPSGPTKPLGVGASTGAPPIPVKKDSFLTPFPDASSKVETPGSFSDALHGPRAENSEDPKSVNLPKSTLSTLNKTAAPASTKSGPETPPQKDFRSILKPRQGPVNGDTKETAEFKNVFGQLRRTVTQNYIAPDALKDNILRGKAGLNVTGGPKKTERKDEFKEAILKKKEDFKKAQLDGTGVIRSPGGSSQQAAPLPEALVRKATLGSSGTLTPQKPSALDGTRSGPSPTTSKASLQGKPGAQRDMSPSSRVQGEVGTVGKLAERFNPTLVTVLARGPPSSLNPSSKTSSPLPAQRNVSVDRMMTPDVDNQKPGPQLTHMTKSRARGPARKAPSAVIASNPATSLTATVKDDKLVIPDTELTVKQFNTTSDTMMKHTIAQTVQNAKLKGDPISSTIPSKLDTKGQSNFSLEEVSNGNSLQTKTVQPANRDNPVLAKEEASTKLLHTKVFPSTRPKPASLSSPPLPRELPNTTKTTPGLTEAEKKSQHISPLVPAKGGLSNPLAYSKNAAPVDKNATLADKSTNDTNRVAPSWTKQNDNLLNRQNIAENARQSLSAQDNSPSKHLTNTGELAAIVRAGLYLPEPTESISSRGIGLGLTGAITASMSSVDTTPWVSPLLKTSTSRGPSTPPPQSVRPFPPSKEIKTVSPQTMINQAMSQSPKAGNLLFGFFEKTNFDQKFDIDTTSALLTIPEDPAKIKTLRSQLYQLSGDGKKQQVPTYQERMLFENDMYVCHHTFATLAGKKTVQVYFWAGDGVAESSIQDAEIFVQREARSAGGKLIKIRQGEEPSEFIEALGGILITRRGSSIKYDSLTPHILCGRRYAGSVVFDEVDFSPMSLCSGFPYLISTHSGKSYLWKGKGSSIDELSCARLIGMDFGVTGDVEEIEDGNEPASFLNVFGADTKIPKSADHWRLKPRYEQYSARLFCAENKTDSQISEITPFTQTGLSPHKIYILDAYFEIYIIVGASSQGEYGSFCTALLFAQEYGILAAGFQDRPFVPVTTVVLEGVPRDLKFLFRKWTDAVATKLVRHREPESKKSSPLLVRGRSLRVVSLSAALDAARF